jgi:hypothetical protein
LALRPQSGACCIKSAVHSGLLLAR